MRVYDPERIDGGDKGGVHCVGARLKICCIEDLRAVLAVTPSRRTYCAHIGIAGAIRNRGTAGVIPNDVGYDEIPDGRWRGKRYAGGCPRRNLVVLFLDERRRGRGERNIPMPIDQTESDPKKGYDADQNSRTVHQGGFEFDVD